MSYLINTNVASEIRKRHNANRNVSSWFDQHEDTSMWIHAVSLMKIQIGVQQAMETDPVYSRVLNEWYYESLVPAHVGRIIVVDRSVTETSGPFEFRRTLPHSDALIAATARHHELKLVTRNTKDFQDFDIELINPWKVPSH